MEESKIANDIFLSEISKFANLSIFKSSNVPSIQSKSDSILMNVAALSNPTSYADHKGFTVEFIKEIELARRIESLEITGNEFVQFVYSYRSISKAIPEVQLEALEKLSESDKNAAILKKTEYSKIVLEVLRPGMFKIKELISFVVEANQVLHACVVHLVNIENSNGTVPEGLYSSMIKLIDVLVKLDNLKDIKSSIKNDFTRYKRVIGSSPDALEELNLLQSFLSNQDPSKSRNYIFLSLRDEIKRIVGHEDVIMNLVDFALSCLDENRYLTPNERFLLIRILPHLILIADGNETGGINVFRQYRSKLSPVQKLLKKFPVVPLFGDMSLNIIYIIERAANFDSENMRGSWVSESNDIDGSVYDLRSSWPSIRENYDTYFGQLTSLRKILNDDPFQKILTPENVGFAEQVSQVIHSGMSYLSSWNGSIQLMLSWKFTHLAPESSIGVSSEYSRALKENLSSSELTALVDTIFMIKSVASVLIEIQSRVAPVLRFLIHHEIQQFVQGDMLPLLHRLDKNKKPILQDVLYLRHMAADWIHQVDPRDNYKTYTRKDGHIDIKHTPRSVGAGATQLLILRAQIRSLMDDRSAVRKKDGFMFRKSDMDSSDVEIFEKFYSRSFYYPYYLCYGDVVRTISDLSDLWYREFFLELSKSIQFPIEMSLPWIITEHILTSQSSDVPLVETLIYALEIYNDVAHRALNVIRQQHLYDEVEAETNLVFDQLVYLVADEAYGYYKSIGASSTIDKLYGHTIERLKGSQFVGIRKRRYDSLLAQKSVHVLGRHVNLSYLISQHIQTKFVRDIDVLIKRYESLDITGLVELRSGITVLKFTHQLLCEHLELDSFESLVHDVNDTFSPNSFKGRINFHFLKNLVMDLFSNHSYNFYTHRFVRSPILKKESEYRKSPKHSSISNLYGGNAFFKTFEYWYRLSRGFVGHIHWEALVEIIGFIDFGMIIDECMKNVQEKLRDMAEYVEALRGGIPPLSMPKNLFSNNFLSAGCFGFYEGRLRSLLDYDDLKPEVFQNLKEIGNTLLFLKDVSYIFDTRNVSSYLLTAPLVGVNPTIQNIESISTTVSPVIDIVGLESLRKTKSADPRSVRLADDLSSLATKSLDLLMQNNLENKSFFVNVLKRVENIMYSLDLFNEWGSGSLSTVFSSKEKLSCALLDIEQTSSFHKLWSALCFLFCLKSNAANKSNDNQHDSIPDEEQFGHGFIFCGCVFVHLLNQQCYFEMMDFSRYVIEVYEYEYSNHNSQSLLLSETIDKSFATDTKEFVEKATEVRKIQDDIFSWLGSGVYEGIGASAREKIVKFKPCE